ncbi:Uncharacterised protein [Streptococcus pneumoniae]|nr:Uncharacterised protein [Streptococcus pneumoniae]
MLSVTSTLGVLPSLPFLTTVSLVEPSGFVTVIVWLPSGFSVVVIFAVLPSLPSLTTVVDSEPSGF